MTVSTKPSESLSNRKRKVFSFHLARGKVLADLLSQTSYMVKVNSHTICMCSVVYMYL